MTRDTLQGWIPNISNAAELRMALDRAFDFRGDVLVTLRDGQRIEGFIFDRRFEGPSLEKCFLRIMPKDRPQKVLLRYSDIIGLEFSGRDAAEGKSFELWSKKYREKKALGEKNISLDPEPLE
jgi:hypothetical protein